MSMAIPPPLLPAQSNAPAAPEQKALDHKQAAQQFEALMLQQFLTAALPRSAGSNNNWLDLALEGVAAELADSMPFGLAQLLEKDA